MEFFGEIPYPLLIDQQLVQASTLSTIIVQQIFGFPNSNAKFMNHQPPSPISQNPSPCRHFEKSNIIKFDQNA
jgi:hypothetical protein